VLRGPGKARLALASRVRRGPSRVQARLELIGSRRGVWKIDLISANRVIASTLVGTR
jgi:hypothetical protein